MEQGQIRTSIYFFSSPSSPPSATVTQTPYPDSPKLYFEKVGGGDSWGVRGSLCLAKGEKTVHKKGA